MPLLAAALVTTLAVPIESLSRQAPAAAKPATQFAGPRVDHHQHLLSAGLAPILAKSEEAEFKPIELPEDMNDLLRRRTAAWNDPVALAKLYSDQVVLAQYADQTLILQDGIISGREAVSDYLATKVFARTYGLDPVAYSDSGPVRHIAAVYARTQLRGDASDFRHIGSALFTIARQADGQWRITSEVLKLPGPPTYRPVDANALVKLLDEAGIERAVVLSGAYLHESPFLPESGDAARLRGENDWTAHDPAPARLHSRVRNAEPRSRLS